MSKIAVTAEVELDDVSTDILINELNERGFDVSKSVPDDFTLFDNFDWEYLLNLVDNSDQNWYTNRVRDKLLYARFDRKFVT